MAKFDSIALNEIKISPTVLHHAFPEAFPIGGFVHRQNFIDNYEGRYADEMLKWEAVKCNRDGLVTELEEQVDPFSPGHVSPYTLIINRFEGGHSICRRLTVGGIVHEQITTTKNGKWVETRETRNGEVCSRMFGGWDAHGNLIAITTHPKPDRWAKGDWRIEDGEQGKVRNWYNEKGELVESQPISRSRIGDLTFENIGSEHFRFRDHLHNDLASSEKMPSLLSGDVVSVHDSKGRYVGFVDQRGTFRLSRVFNSDGVWGVMRSSRPFRDYANCSGKLPTAPIVVRKGSVRPEFEKIL